MTTSCDFTALVIDMLGETERCPAPAAAWDDLEQELGIPLPDDYKTLISRYAPVQLNHHLFLNHPSTDRWNLGRFMRDTVDTFMSHSDLTDVVRQGFTDPPFGAPSGLIPLLNSDRGEGLFGAFDAGTGQWRLFACDGDEALYYEYKMPFSEWLHRYLAGEDMFGPGSGVFYPGPIVFESMPMTATQAMIHWKGPERGM
ncbi:SMI1/KNR4 family protein [Streptomyces sp. SID7958]|uniref:SMI1/KNR4 family protein n=2 Tax=unclassified Streptomyces TaxID=2593676 RepID=A0A6G3R0W8_9ACTN|nr:MULTISPECIES: SMI1/KNR4 family protein [unclassified Streptomyces]NEA89235.1 SMI1/KNR4 family protein [Streptomyces sp. SID14436]NEC82574.1 SMI1/KNR4 family protein [Streptomyces sp. SID7958]